MASPSDLNVKVALDLREFSKGLKEMERTLRSASANLSSIGSSLTLGLTVPLIAAGAAAVKAAGDFEELFLGLKTTMADAGYNVGQVAFEMEKLREVGKDPGIGFEQAVKASLRLQGVGFSADRARVTIQNLAKAVAASGGSAESLDRVTVQMAQMIGKGKVLATDLQVMKESLPSLAGLMQKAFGATTAEQIRDMGINADQFIRGINEQMKEIGKVPSGINNEIVNLMGSLKQFFAGIGEELNRMFDITGTLHAFSDWLEGAVVSWKGMSDGTKETIVQIALFAAALGPAFKLVSVFQTGISAVVGVYRQLAVAAKTATAAQTGLSGAWKALDATMKASIIGAVVAIVISLGVALAASAREATAMEKAQAKVVDVQKNAAATAENQSRHVNDLTDVIQSHKTTLDQKRQALKELQKISPEYYGKFGQNVKDTNAIAEATKQYTKELIRLETVKAATAEIGKLNVELKSVEKNTELGFLEGASAIIKFGDVIGQVTSGPKSLKEIWNDERAAKIGKTTTEINTQIQELEKLIDETQKISDVLPPATKKIEESGESSKEAAKKVKVYEEALSDVQNVMKQAALTGSTDTFDDQVEAIDKAIKKLLDNNYSPDSPQVKQFLDMMKVLRGEASLAPATLPTAQLPEKIQTTAVFEGARATAEAEETIDALGAIGTQAVDTTIKINGLSTGFASMLANMGMSVEGMKNIGDGMKIMAESSADAFQGLAESALGVDGAYTRMGAAALVAASKMVKAALAATIAKAIQDSLTKSGHPLLGVALAGVAVAGVTALFARLEQSVSKSPKFAKGGMVFGPTSAIVGDNPGASVDPEVIAPLSKLREYMQPSQSMYGGEFRIKGYDLVLAMEKNMKINNRIR